MTKTEQHVDEVGELIASLLVTPATRLTSCRGWTAHELVAHLAAGAAEEADLIEAHVAGTPRLTRGFEERELPFRQMPDAELRDRLVEEAARLGAAMEVLSARGDDRVLFTGRPMTALEFAMHSRSECALHRWDLVGRDDVAWEMLAQPALTRHALTVLTSMSTLPEAPANRLAALTGRPQLDVVIRSEPEDDVVMTVGPDTLRLTMRPIDGTPPGVELDAAARLLLLWGRREPSAPIDVYATGAAAVVLESMFGW